MYQPKSAIENAMVQILFVNYYLGNSIPVKMVIMTLSAVEKVILIDRATLYLRFFRNTVKSHI